MTKLPQTAQRGMTTYRLDEDCSAGFVRLLRVDGRGKRVQIFFPEDMLEDYAAALFVERGKRQVEESAAAMFPRTKRR